MERNKWIMTLAACLGFTLTLSGNALAGSSPVITPTGTIVMYAGQYLTPCYIGNSFDGDGGEFTATTTPTGGGASTIFTTFCLQQSVYFNLGETYNYSISEVLGEPTDVPGSPYLTTGAAWLYYQFENSPAGTYDDSQADVTEFQDAIWELEKETVYSSNGAVIDPTNPDTLNQDYINAVNATGAAALDENTSIGGVYAAVLTIQSGGNAQNQLIFLPGDDTNVRSVPDSGASVMLLGMALGSVALLRRKVSA